MRNKWKNGIAVLLALLLLPGLTACGKDAAPFATGEDAAVTAAETAAPLQTAAPAAPSSRASAGAELTLRAR